MVQKSMKRRKMLMNLGLGFVAGMRSTRMATSVIQNAGIIVFLRYGRVLLLACTVKVMS